MLSYINWKSFILLHRKKPPVQYVRCEMEGCGTVLAHPRYLQVQTQTSASLTDWYLTQKLDLKPFCCLSSLQHHIKYQHLMKKKYVCPHPSCGRLFRLQKQLLRHAKHHTGKTDPSKAWNTYNEVSLVRWLF